MFTCNTFLYGLQWYLYSLFLLIVIVRDYIATSRLVYSIKIASNLENNGLSILMYYSMYS